MIYFDNGASTYKKPTAVVNAVTNAMLYYTANPGRSGHMPSIEGGNKINEVRENLALYFNAESPKNVIFTKSCTEALNLAILGNFKKNGHVIITSSDHNSVLRPVFELQKQQGLEISIVQSEDGKISLENIKKLVKKNTYMICTNHISNVDGTIAEIEKIGKFCYLNNIIYLVDGAQSAGHSDINIKEMKIDLLCLAGHKGLYGPQGVGVLLFTEKAKPQPILYGGTGTESISVYQPKQSPECYESGTNATPAILGLGAGLEFVKKNSFIIEKHLEKLTKYAIEELSNINGITIYTKPCNLFGVVCFNVKDIESSFVSNWLGERYEICTRNGLHCAPLKHKELGTTKQGAVRISFSLYNTFEEIDIFIKAIKEFICEMNS